MGMLIYLLAIKSLITWVLAFTVWTNSRCILFQHNDFLLPMKVGG
jgi:hypothetical protein